MTAKKNFLEVLVAVAIQLVLLFFWAMLLIETVCPIYRWSYSMGVIGANIGENMVVYAPQRVETFLTPSAEKLNNRNFSEQSIMVQNTFVCTYQLQSAPQYKILQKNHNTLIYELSSEEQPQKWIVSVYFGAENAFDISITEAGGDAA